MSLSDALMNLVAAVEAGGGSAVLGFDEVQQWGQGVAGQLVDDGLLKPYSPAQSLVCHGCEERCFSDVVVQPMASSVTRAFIICEVPHMREQMGRVPVQVERLQQWRSTTSLLAAFLADKLGLEYSGEVTNDSQPKRLGMIKGQHGRRWVSLMAVPLSLELNQQTVPLIELLFTEAGVVALDMPRIQAMLKTDVPAAGKLYTSNLDRREAAKAQTQAMYQDWQDAYEVLLVKHPHMGKAWYSQQIAKLSVAQGRDSETIRKRIK